MAFQTLSGALRLDTSKFDKGLDSADRGLGGLADKSQSVGRRMQKAGGIMTAGITAPLTAMGAFSAKSAADFDAAMQQSIAVMGDVDDAMRTRLEDTAREVATSMGVSHSEAAESFYFLASAGLDAEESMAALPTVAALAEAGQMDMAEATDVATNVMSAYGMEAENMSRITDVMTKTVQSHNQTMEGMSQAFRNAAPAAASMGVELEELAALTGALGDVGIQGAEAGTALNSIMRRFAKDGGEAAQVLDEVGVQTTDADGNLRSLTEIFGELEDANLSAAQTSALFGRQMSAGNALLNAGQDELEEYQQNINDSEGATEDLAATQRDTLNEQLALAKDNFTDVAISMGSIMLPALETLTGGLQTTAEWMQNLSDRQRTAILVVGGLAAAIGPVLVGLGTLGVMAPAVATGFGVLAGGAGTLAGVLTGGLVPAALAANVALGPITVPIWAIIAAIGALIAIGAGLYHAWTNNMFGIRDITTDAFETVRGWLDAAPDWVLSLLGPIGWLYMAWRENLFGIQNIVGSVFDWIGQKIAWLIDKIESIPGINFGDDPPDAGEAVPNPADVEQEGASAGQAGGEAYKQAYEQSAQPEAGAIAPGGTADEASSEEAGAAAGEDFVSGFKGYVDPATAAITEEDIIEASTEGGVTPEDLGISEEDFNAILDGGTLTTSGGGSRSSGSGSSTSGVPSAATPGTSSARSSRLSAEDIADAFRSVLEDLRLRTKLEIDEREFQRIIDERAEIVVKDVAGGSP